VHKKVAANDAKRRAKALVGAARCRDLRALRIKKKEVPAYSVVVSVTRGTRGRKRDVACVLTFIHHAAAKSFVHEAQKIRAARCST